MINNLQMWAAIVGFLMPPAIAVVQQRHWQAGLKAVVAFVLCLAVSVGTVYLQGPETFSWHRWISASLTTLVAAIATYHGLWKPTGTAPAIESSTTLPGSATPPA